MNTGMKHNMGLAFPDLKDFVFRLAEKSCSVFWIRSTDYNQQIYVSPAYETIWGRSCQSLYDHPEKFNDFLFPDDRERLNIAIAARKPEVHPQTIYQESYRIIRPDGEIRWIKDTSYPIYNRQGEHIGFAGIAEDVTKEKQREIALMEAKERAEAANQAKANFLATVSHELRTPLNGVIGMADILSRENLKSHQLEHIQDIIDSGQYLLALVNDILNFAKLDEGKIELSNESFNLKKLIQNLLINLKHQINNKKVSLKFNYDKQAPTEFIGDELRIQQIIINLVTNAIKFTDQGFIKIDVVCKQLLKQKAKLQIIVSDSGKGIAPEKINKIFDRFYQAEKEFPYIQVTRGIGLGLAICKELIDAMNGKIQVKSELNKGTTLTIDLTIQLAKTATRSSLSSQATKIKSSKKLYTALLVEDETINCKVAKLLLEHKGGKIIVAKNGKQALNLLKNQCYDIIFMDIQLPDLSGVDITKRLRQMEKTNKQNPTPIIALTGHALEDEKRNFISAGVSDILLKPIQQNHVDTILTKWLK